MVDFAFSNFVEDSVLNNFFRNTVSSAVAPDVALFIQDAGVVVTFTNATNLVNDTSTALVNGDVLTFTNSSGALPTGITAAIRYYVINQNTNDYQVSLSFGGAAVTFSDDGSGTNTQRDFLNEANSGQTEASGNGYSRQAVTFAAPTTSNDRRQVQNSAAVLFTASGGNLGGGVIDTVALFDSGSNMLCAAPITPVTVDDGDTLRFNTNQLTAQMN